VFSTEKRAFISVYALLFFLFYAPVAHGEWERLNQGLELGSFLSPHISAGETPMIRVLRIDLQHYGIRLLNASAKKDKRSMTAREWSRKYGLTAAINASMYQADHITSVSLMRTKGHINNPRLSKDKAILAFDRKGSNLPEVRIFDRQCDNVSELRNRFRTLVQSIRMISCRGTNVWQRQTEPWSTAALAIDRNGKILFIHVKVPHSTHDLINILQALPLAIDRAMYLEGGPEAQLFVQGDKKFYEFFGSYSGTFANTTSPGYAWPIPNILGIIRKPTNSSGN